MNRTLVLNILCLQGAWLTAAIMQERSTLWLLLILGIRVLAFNNQSSQIKPVLMLALIGLASELLMIAGGIISYNTAFFMPMWLPVLWLIFALTMSQTLKLLSGYSLSVQALVGAVCGCFNYQAAATFDVLQLQPDRFSASIALLVIWACTLPLLSSAQKYYGKGVVC